MPFLIEDVPLIPQTNDMACWYASAQMLIAWRRNRTRMKEKAHPDPSQVPQLAARVAANHGLPFSQTIEMARLLGLTPVPPMTPSPDAIAIWLAQYGPLWFAGLFPSGHAVVITGIDQTQIAINDPWPPNIGRRRHLAFAEFGQDIQPLHAGPDNLWEALKQLLSGERGPLTPNLLYFGD
jgi:hypothetical protein